MLVIEIQQKCSYQGETMAILILLSLIWHSFWFKNDKNWKKLYFYGICIHHTQCRIQSSKIISYLRIIWINRFASFSLEWFVSQINSLLRPSEKIGILAAKYLVIFQPQLNKKFPGCIRKNVKNCWLNHQSFLKNRNNLSTNNAPLSSKFVIINEKCLRFKISNGLEYFTSQGSKIAFALKKLYGSISEKKSLGLSFKISL